MFADVEDVLIGHEQVVVEEVVFGVLPRFFGGIAVEVEGGISIKVMLRFAAGFHAR